MSCHGHAILLITFENNRSRNQNTGNYFGKSHFTVSNGITIHAKKTSHFTFHGKIEIEVTTRIPVIILESHILRFLMVSRFTRRKQAIPHFTRKIIGYSRITPRRPLTALCITRLILLNQSEVY